MILIQLILIIGFITLALVFFRKQSSHQLSAWSKIFMVLFAMIAIFVVASPETSNEIAQALGVTRGADLLLYALTLCFLFATLNHYIVRKREHERLVKLARKLALLESRVENEHPSSYSTAK